MFNGEELVYFAQFTNRFLPPTSILLIVLFNSVLAEFTLLVASALALDMASFFLVSAYDFAELRVEDTLVSTLALVS